MFRIKKQFIILFIIFTFLFQFTKARDISVEYWSSGVLDFVSCYEAGRGVVAYKLGFNVEKIKTYKSGQEYTGITEFEKESFEKKFDYKKIEDIETVNDQLLKDLVCVSFAGGIAIKKIYGFDYQLSLQEENIINGLCDELVKRNKKAL